MPDVSASTSSDQQSTASVAHQRSEGSAFRQKVRRKREEIGSQIDAARTTSNVPALLRLLFSEIELWTQELKHETLALFEDSEYGRYGRQMMRGAPANLTILPGYIMLGFNVAPDAHDLVELAIGEPQAKALAGRLGELDEHRHRFGERVARLAATWDDEGQNDYNKLAEIDRYRSDLKLAALDLCRYIDTLAHLAESRSGKEQSAAPVLNGAGAQSESREQTDRTEQPGRSSQGSMATIVALLQDANHCQMALADMRRDFLAMSSVSGRMEGGGEDWHFASHSDESDYQDAKRRIDRGVGELVEKLSPLLDWGCQTGLEVAGNAKFLQAGHSSSIKAEICASYELDVRNIITALTIERAKGMVAPPVDSSPRRGPVAVWLAAETMKSIAIRLLFHSGMLRADKPSEYDDQDNIRRDFLLAEKHGYLLIAVARQLSLDPAPIIRILREDRLWGYPNEPEDSAVFRAAGDVAERISVEARVWCAEAGIDPEAEFRQGKTATTDSDADTASKRDSKVDESEGANDPPASGGPAEFNASLKSGSSGQMSPDQWRMAGLGLLMLLAQAYYKILEGAISMASWCNALDLELNHSYLWTVQNLGNLLKNHEELRDFPVAFEPLFPDLYPSTIRDLDWQDMVAPDAEKFLSAVQQYVFSKKFSEPEKGSDGWVFIELFRPAVTTAIERAAKYHTRMRQHALKLMGKTPTSATATPAQPDTTSSSQTGSSAVSQSQPQRSDDQSQRLPFEIVESAFKVVMGTKTKTFSGRSKLPFALFVRISKRPGHQVSFDSLRQVGDIWNGSEVEDSTIKGAISRLREELRSGGMSALADAIKTGKFSNRSFVILELERLALNSN